NGGRCPTSEKFDVQPQNSVRRRWAFLGHILRSPLILEECINRVSRGVTARNRERPKKVDLGSEIGRHDALPISTKVGLSRTHSEKPPYPGGMHKQGFPRGDGAKSRETEKSGLRLRTEKNLSSMRLSNLILADFNALLRRSRVPSCLPRLLETHTEYGFLFVSLSTSPTLPFSPTLSLGPVVDTHCGRLLFGALCPFYSTPCGTPCV